MSVITSVMLKLAISESKRAYNMASLNNWLNLNTRDSGQIIRRVEFEDQPGNAIGFCIYVGAINYLNVDEFLEFIETLEWSFAGAVEIMILTEDHYQFEIYRFDETEKSLLKISPDAH